MIRHLVLSGGGDFGFVEYGILKESAFSGFWDIKNIQTIYSTSVGAIVATLIQVGLSWEELDRYIIDRPWEEVFKIDIVSLMNAYGKKGILDCQTISNIIRPCLTACDLTEDITLYDFFKHTNIEFHIMTVELNSFSLVDLSYKTHPEWRLIDAVYASASVPVLFAPLFYKDTKDIYIDGGFYASYPLKQCIDNPEVIPDEIFGICKKNERRNTELTEQSTLYDFIMFLIYKFIHKISNIQTTPVIKYELVYIRDAINLQSIHLVANDKILRRDLIQSGVMYWNTEKENICL